MRTALILAPILLSACATGEQGPPQLTEKQAAALEKELSGKTAGAPVNCISIRPQTNLRAISDRVLLYRVSSRLVYKNEVSGVCSGLTRGNTLITQSWGTQYCRGDIARVADLTAGMPVGSCSLGEFIPYQSPPK